jgi:membrane dipeptidase
MKIFDGHNDILNKITKTEHPLDSKAFLARGEGHLDLPRALMAGFAGGFFAVYPSNPPSVPGLEESIILSDDGYRIPLSPPLEYDYASQSVERMINLLFQIERDSLGQFRVVTDLQSLRKALDENVLAAVLHLEGAEAITRDLSNLKSYYQRGMRSLGITWSRPNEFGHGVPFSYPSGPDTGPGLTNAGKDLVQACNQLGVMIDLAHLNEKGFWDVADLSDAPLVSTHTAACALVPKARNLTDKQLKAVAESNGVIGVIFSVNDLDGGKRPKNDAPISKIVDHIQYISDLIGTDHVAFGSDFDGTKIPSALGDVSGLPKLVGLLDQAGFTSDEQEKICSKNWVRVLTDTWKM